MAGDIVLYEYEGQKTPAKVVEIYRDSVLVEDISGEYEPIEIDEAKIYPTEITPEILEKNGFVYNDLPFVQAWEQFGLALYSGGNGYRIGCGNNVALIIDSVHELQHCLKLCGIDKSIEL